MRVAVGGVRHAGRGGVPDAGGVKTAVRGAWADGRSDPSLSRCPPSGRRRRRRDALDAGPGQPLVVRARDEERAVEPGRVEVQLRLGHDVRIGDDFEVGIEAERQHGAGDGAGEPLGGLGVAEADVARVEQRPDGVQVDPPVPGDDREEVACGAAVHLDPQHDALRGLGGRVAAQGADRFGTAFGLVVDEAVVDGGGVEQGDQVVVGVVVGVDVVGVDVVDVLGHSGESLLRGRAEGIGSSGVLRRARSTACPQ